MKISLTRTKVPFAIKMIRFIGRSTASWIALGIAGTVSLGIVELGIASFIQIFLKSLGLISPDMANDSFLLKLDVPTWMLGVGLICLGCVRFVGQYLVSQAGVSAQEKIIARLRRVLCFKMLLHSKQSFTPSTESHYYLGSIFPYAGSAVYSGMVFCAHALQACILIVIMLLTTWREALLGVSGLVIIGLVVHRINRSIRQHVAGVPGENKALVSGIERVSKNWLLVRILRTQGLEYRQFIKNVDSVHRLNLSASSLSNLVGAGAPFFGIILLVLIIFCSQSYWKTPSIMLVSFLYIFIRFVQNLATTVHTLSATNHTLPQLREAFSFFYSFNELERRQATGGASIDSYGEGMSAGSTRKVNPPAISLRNVSFGYDQRTFISNLSLTIEPGQTFGIIGASGSGKSTLLLLMLGILKPQDGEIFVDGVNADSLLADRTLEIGYVGPEPFLFAGTVRENLSYGHQGFPDDMLWKALKLAKMFDEIHATKGKLDHYIHENGDGLSAGQKQRLCLARIFLRQPNLVILDEATANLDSKTELDIVASLATLKGKATIVIVTHRQAALKYSDRVLMMESSSLVSPDCLSFQSRSDHGRLETSVVPG